MILSISGRSEAYIDQSRGISVNIGSADIRTSMLKSRMFLSKTYVFMQEEQQGYKVFVEQAAHEMHKGAFDRALGYLNRAISHRKSLEILRHIVAAHQEKVINPLPPCTCKAVRTRRS